MPPIQTIAEIIVAAITTLIALAGLIGWMTSIHAKLTEISTSLTFFIKKIDDHESRIRILENEE